MQVRTVRKHTFCFVLLLLLLAGCAYNDNSHLRSAVPLDARQAAASLGYSNFPILFPLHSFEPAEVDSTIRSYQLNTFSMQFPLSYDIGLGKGYNFGLDMGIQMGPRFEGAGYEEYFVPPTFNPFIKASVQKSADFGHGFYAALSPAVSAGRGVDNVRRGWRSRFAYSSLELPLTISKMIDFPLGGSFVLSLTARAARDWLASDLNGPGTGAWTYITYPDQPLLIATRYAAMGTVEYRFEGRIFMALQWGREEATVKSNSRLDPVFAFRLGYITH